MRERPGGWGVESTHYHGPNWVSFKIVTGYIRTPLVRVYLPPLTLEHLLDFEEALQRFKGLDSIFLGDLNVDPDKSWSLQSQRIADLLTEFGLIDLVRHF